MLTKKQLKELAKNYGMEVTVGDIPAVAAAKVALAYRETLEKLEWVENIVWECKQYNIPVFMKNSLKEIMSSDFIQEWPESLKQTAR